MKVTIDIDCTAEEAREFLGLPEVKPIQDRLMKEAGERMSAAMAAMDGEAMMRMWMPAGVQGLEQMQKFWANLARGGGRGAGGKEGSK